MTRLDAVSKRYSDHNGRVNVQGFHFRPASSKALEATDRCAVLVLPVVPLADEPYSDMASRFSSSDGVLSGVSNGSVLSFMPFGFASAKSVSFKASATCGVTFAKFLLVLALASASSCDLVHSGDNALSLAGAALNLAT